MTAFTFLHAADLHLGSPFLGLSLKDEELARRMASAGRDAFHAMVEAAIAKKVAFVVIAGDIYDGEWKDASIGLFFNREVARLDRAGIRVFLVKGNHDAESVVTKSVTLPGSVSEFPSRVPASFRLDELKVVLHGRSFPDRVVAENYALTYPAAQPGWFNIGVLHSSCTGRPPHAPYAPCTLQDLATRGYQYWALGHVHAHEILSQDPYVVYPGNIQGRSIRETGAKGVVLVDVVDGAVTGLRRLILDKARFALVPVDLGGVESVEAALGRIEEALREPVRQAEGRLLLARIELVGETTLHRRLAAERQMLRDEVQAAAHRLHEDTFIEDLVMRTSEPRSLVETGRVETGLLDPAALIAGLEADAGLRAEAQALLGQIAGRLPASVADGSPPLADELDTLLREATALVLGRLTLEDS
ncbi:DNA repair exonuclease SbcCD nuclease subunit [Rhizobiales bacterium GAS191]|nr:DNA repair exonuclease SbcCD nuclease subunit [Rhizobiales bacterium GAS191]